MGLEKVNLDLKKESATEVVGGTEVLIERVDGSVIDGAINHTAYHEACHALAGMLLNIAVFEATDIPGPGYGGYTSLAEYDPTVTAAAEAMGCDGTGHDMWTIVEMGDDPDAAVASARSLLSGRQDELNAVATSIQQGGVATGSDMAEQRGRITTDLVEVTITNPDGTKHTEFKSLRRGEVYIDIPREYPDVKQ